MRIGRAVVGAGVAVVALAAAVMPASAHSGGRVQLFIDRLSLHPAGGDGWRLSLELVDADSGTPAPGFDVVAEATDGGGLSTGPVVLADGGDGRYSGLLTAAAGSWQLAVRAASLPGGTPGVPLRKEYPLVLEPGKDVAVETGPSGGGGSEPAPDAGVRVQRTDKVGQTPLWIPIRVTVTDGDSGRPLPVDHLVYAAAGNSAGDEAGPFNLGPLEANDPAARGVHEGFVIVPYGGPWIITAVARTAPADPGVESAVLGRGSAEVAVDAPVTAEAAAAAGDGPDSEPFGVAVLWLHTMVAVGWGITVALLALLALPAGRRFLSDHGANLLDGHLDRITRAAWWLTGLVVGTGIYNLVNSVAYRVPLSPEQARRLFRLPYAQPYYLAMGTKLAVYAVMIGATVPLIAEARRRAAVDDDHIVLVPDDDPSPWDDPARSQEAEPAGGVALRSKPARTAVAESRAGSSPFEGRAGVPVAIVAGGGVVIVGAVTLLQYFHLLGEVARATG